MEESEFELQLKQSFVNLSDCTYLLTQTWDDHSPFSPKTRGLRPKTNNSELKQDRFLVCNMKKQFAYKKLKIKARKRDIYSLTDLDKR